MGYNNQINSDKDYSNKEVIGFFDADNHSSKKIVLDYEGYQPLLDREYSFEAGITPSQTTYLKRILMVLGLGLLLQPHLVITALLIVFYVIFALLIIWRLILVIVGARLLLKSAPNIADIAGRLPTYSILVPLYDEADIMPQLAKALKQLDWPKARLDIQLLIEADDRATLEAARKARFSRQTRITIVPPGGPRTKPNALNYGLSRAKGRFVCVYDAEDQPEPGQLKAAYHAFQNAELDLACVQAPLVGDNSDEALIAAHWSLEYAAQFGLLIPALAAMNLPILIGGTSNHFRKSALLAAGGWDPYNVTEDADLGMRFARARLRTSVIAPATHEDAPTSLSIWTPQRSRWIKGFMQSWLVLMRQPRTTLKQMGLKSFAVMQLCLGGAIIAPLLHLPFAAMVATAPLISELSIGRAGWALLSAGLLVGFLSDVLAPGEWSAARCLAIVTRPFYWPLQSLAAYRGLWELAVRPFFWAKTPHKPRRRESAPPCSIGLSASA